MRRLWLAALVASAAWADAKRPNPFLSQAKVFATQGEGDKCLKRLIQAEQKWKYNDKKDRAEIEMYGGICGYLVGETQAAEVSFKNAVKIDPRVELPRELGPGIEQLWSKATGKTVPLASSGPGPTPVDKNPKKVDPKVAENPPPKKEEPPPAKVEPAPVRQREPTPDEKLEAQLVAEAGATPQKKGRNVLVPVLFGIGGVGAGVGGLVLGLQAKSAESVFKSTDTFYSDAQKAASAARTNALVANVLFVAAGALVIAAVVAFILSG